MSQPTMPDRERRIVPTTRLEVRVSKEGDPPKIEGYAAVFNQPSEVMADWGGRFREFVAEGAFTKTLQGGADVRALLNHDPNYVLGRSKAGTLRLWEDSKGLGYEVTPPDTQWARDLLAVMRRGDIDQSSFAFQTVRDRWGVGEDAEGEEIDERWLLEVRLFDVSPVTYPAYPQTSSSVRSLPDGLGDLSADDWRSLLDFIKGLRDAPGPAPHPSPSPDPTPGPSPHAGRYVPMDRYRRWLERVS